MSPALRHRGDPSLRFKDRSGAGSGPSASALLCAALTLLLAVLTPLTAASAASSGSAESAAPVGSAAPISDTNSVYACTAYGTLPRYNTVESNRDDVYGWYIFDDVKAGDGSGDIDWTLDPHEDSGWKLWFSSLRWIGPSIEAGRDGDAQALTKAETIIRDWIADHGTSWRDNLDHMEANTHRLNVLLCFREVIMERNGGELPESYGWLTEALHRHAEHNIYRWSGAHNHGSMENRALLGLGCLLGRKDYQEHAIARVKKALPEQITAEGLSNEAAPHYMLFNYRLLTGISELMERCGHDATEVDRPLTLMGENLAHMTNSLGYYWQYGDSQIYQASEEVPPEALYAATDAQQGTRPEDRVKVFDAGVAFGRESWGTPETGFADEASWMLRGGTGKEKKAHHGDLMQFLYTAQGRDVVVDGGHPGIVDDSWRQWGLGPLAHNTIHVPTAEMADGGPVTVTRSDFPDGGADFVEMTQQFPAEGTRTRGVLVMYDPDIAVVLDRTEIGDPGTRHTVQTLWNLPPDETSTVVDRSTVRSSVPDEDTQTTFAQVPFWGEEAVDKGETAVYRGTDGTEPRGHYYPKEQQRVPTDQIVFSRHGNRVGTLSVIVPAAKSEQVEISRTPTADGGLELSIRVGASTSVVSVAADGHLSQRSPTRAQTAERVRLFKAGRFVEALLAASQHPRD